jgi:hypothetical protein
MTAVVLRIVQTIATETATIAARDGLQKDADAM